MRRCSSFAATGRGNVRAALVREEGWARGDPNERVNDRNADMSVRTKRLEGFASQAWAKVQESSGRSKSKPRVWPVVDVPLAIKRKGGVAPARLFRLNRKWQDLFRCINSSTVRLKKTCID